MISRCCSMVLFISTILFSTLFLVSDSSALSENEKKAGYTALFNGKDLSGWTATGNSDRWIVKDGAITGLSNGGGYLHTDKIYENFILKLEYKIADSGNSGIFFHYVERGRSSQMGGEIQVLDSYGKKPDKNSGGSLYDVFPPAVNACKPSTEWNSVKIVYIWPILKVTMNGIVIHDRDMRDHENTRWRARSGPIAFQDHGSSVWYRDIRLMDLGGNEKSEWIPLFNGKSLDGWESFGAATWNIEGDVIKAENGVGSLVTKKKFKDYHLWTAVLSEDLVQGGVLYRWLNKKDQGHQAIINNATQDNAWKTGSIKDIQPAPYLYPGDGSWFGLQVIAQGNQSTVLVNGKVMAKYDRTKEVEGSVGLHIENPLGILRFADLRIKPL